MSVADETGICREMEGLIADSALGEPLPADLGQSLARHLEECPACRELLGQYRTVWGSLSLSPPPDLAEAASRKVLARIRPFPLRWRIPAWIAAAAASFLLGFAAWRLLLPEPPPGVSVSSLTMSADGSGELQPGDVLREYLVEADSFLSRVEGDRFGSWRELNGVILSADLQGRGAYLLEALPPGSPSRNLVQRLHRSFAGLLAAGRGRENEPVELPASWDPRLEQAEVRRLLQEDPGEAGP